MLKTLIDMFSASRSIDDLISSPLSAAELDYLRGGLIKMSPRLSDGQLRDLGMLLIELSQTNADFRDRRRVEVLA